MRGVAAIRQVHAEILVDHGDDPWGAWAYVDRHQIAGLVVTLNLYGGDALRRLHGQLEGDLSVRAVEDRCGEDAVDEDRGTAECLHQGRRLAGGEGAEGKLLALD